MDDFINFFTKILMLLVIAAGIRGYVGGPDSAPTNTSSSWAASAPAFQPGDQLGEIVGNKIRVRNRPDTRDGTNVIGVVEAGNVVWVETAPGYHVSGRIGRDPEGEWFEIRNAENLTGYIAAKFVRRFVAE